MAFQNRNPFYAFLHDAAAGASLGESAVAENYILDERVATAREEEFLQFNDFASALHNRDNWFKQHAEYTSACVALPPVSGTFTAINQPAWLLLQPDSDVVRVETIRGMVGRAKSRGSDVDEAEAGSLIREMLQGRESRTPMNPFKEARLVKWLGHINDGSDRRPAFVAPFAEVEVILKQPDWASRLRDALGLGHIRPSPAGPAVIVLMQYNLRRVHDAHIGRPAWAATPTVLDDVSGQMPSACFFPAPKKASADGYGYTVDLNVIDPTYTKEFLHGHLEYMLEDICRIGEISLEVSAAQIQKARKAHCQLLSADLVHFADLPAKP